MSRRKNKRRSPTQRAGFTPGQIPGAAVYTGPARDFAVRIRAMRYDDTHFEESEDYHPDPEGEGDRAGKQRLWIDVQGIHHVERVLAITDHFRIHPLTVEDIVSPGHRAKFEAHENYLLIVLQMRAPDVQGYEQVAMVLGRGWLASFQELEGDCFDPIRERLRQALGRVRKRSSDYLAYALLDAVVDDYALTLRQLDDRILGLEDKLDEGGDGVEQLPSQLHGVKRELQELRSAVAPLRDEVGRLTRDENPLIGAQVRPFFRDLHDHLVQIAENIEIYRENVRSLLDLHLSNVSQKMNEDMRLLTVVATIFIPLTFLAGVYGMNFEHIPELKWRWAYPTFWGVTLAMLFGLGLFFHRRRWL